MSVPGLSPAEVAESQKAWRAYADRLLGEYQRTVISIGRGRTGTAVFIANRRTVFSEFALNHVPRMLGEDWGLALVVEPGMQSWAAERVADWGAVAVHSLVVPDSGTGSGTGSGTIAGVAAARDPRHRLLRTPTFWEQFETENLLLFDSASLILRPIPEAYLAFDYVGAPWPEDRVSPWCRNGSGGFSLRRKSAMLDVIERCNTHHWLIPSEDVFFSLCMALSPDRYTLPSLEEARAFAVEQLDHHRPVALHEAWKYQPRSRLDALLGESAD